MLSKWSYCILLFIFFGAYATEIDGTLSLEQAKQAPVVVENLKKKDELTVKPAIKESSISDNVSPQIDIKTNAENEDATLLGEKESSNIRQPKRWRSNSAESDNDKVDEESVVVRAIPVHLLEHILESKFPTTTTTTTRHPTWWTTRWPTHRPTHWPTYRPTHPPTHWPTYRPTHPPTHRPTHHPTHWPTHHPTYPTHWPTHRPPTHNPWPPSHWPPSQWPPAYWPPPGPWWPPNNDEEAGGDGNDPPTPRPPWYGPYPYNPYYQFYPPYYYPYHPYYYPYRRTTGSQTGQNQKMKHRVQQTNYPLQPTDDGDNDDDSNVAIQAISTRNIQNRDQINFLNDFLDSLYMKPYIVKH